MLVEVSCLHTSTNNGKKNHIFQEFYFSVKRVAHCYISPNTHDNSTMMPNPMRAANPRN